MERNDKKKNKRISIIYENDMEILYNLKKYYYWLYFIMSFKFSLFNLLFHFNSQYRLI